MKDCAFTIIIEAVSPELPNLYYDTDRIEANGENISFYNGGIIQTIHKKRVKEIIVNQTI